MKIRGLLVATFVFFVLFGILYWSEHHKPSETAKVSADTPPAILKLDASAITTLDLQKKDAAPIILTKGASGNWEISEPKALRADQSTVSGIVDTVSKLNSERLVEDKAGDLKQYGLDQPAFQLAVTEKNNQTQKVLIGDETPTGGSVYAMLAGDPRIFTMASYTRTSIDKNLNDLRDKRLLTVNPDKVSQVTLVAKNQDIEFGRNKDEWQILKPKPLRADSFEVGDLVRKLAEAKMDLSSSDANDADSAFAHAKPIATAKLTDESGTQVLQVRKDKDTYYAKSSAVTGAYKVDANLGQAVDKGLDDFRNKKIFDFGYIEPNKIELHNGSKAYFLIRNNNNEDWWWNGKKMDAGSVQSLVSDLRDLSANKFVDSGAANSRFASPAIEAAVTSDDGKRVEKVAIAKDNDGYIARRENDPTLYQLNSSSIQDIQKAAEEIKPAPAPGK